MAVYNLENYTSADGLGFPLNFRRGNPNPLDNSSVWKNLSEAQAYAQSDPTAYVGQILTVVNNTAGTVTAYMIKNVAGDLESLATGTSTGDVSSDVTALSNKIGESYAAATAGDGSIYGYIKSLETSIGTSSDASSAGTVYGAIKAEAEAREEAIGDASTSTADDGSVYGAIKATEADLSAHISNKENPHAVTKDQVGLGNVTNDAQVKRSEMGVANGVATLDENGLVPASQLPSYVDDVIEAANFASLPAEGEAGKIYVTLDDNKTYRWSGTIYTIISDSIALGETSSTAYAGDKGKANAEAIASLNTAVDLLNGADTEVGSVANSIKTAIEGLDVTDAAVAHQFVTAVSEEDGKISVSRAALVADDIPELAISKITDLQTTLDSKATDNDLTALENLVGKPADKDSGTTATGIFKTVENLTGGLNGLGTAAEKDVEYFATAAQGAKADSAIQTVKVNGNDLAATDNAVNITVASGATNGTLAVNNIDVAVKGLGSAAYTEADAYATADHNHDANYADKTVTEAHIANTEIHVTTADKTSWNGAATQAAANKTAIDTLNGDSSVAGSVAYKINTAITNLDLDNTYATKAQGALADSAIQNLTILGQTLSKTNSSLDVATAKTALGLGSAAYESKDAFDAAGAADGALAAAKSYTDTRENALRGNPDEDDSAAITIHGTRKYADEAVDTLENSLAAVAKSGAAADVSIADAGNKITATNVEGALQELATAVANNKTAGEVTITESGATADAAKVYSIKQGGTEVGVINIPKDMVVKSGSVVTLDAEDDAGHAAGTYIKITLQNSNNELWINVADLIEYVSGGTATDGMITTTVDSSHVLTATINDGTITLAKLAAGVQTSLGKADSAVQSVTVLGKALSDGQALSADEAKTALGLKSAAYVDTTAFDAAGAADDALADALAADEKVVLQKYNTSSYVTSDTATSFTVPMNLDAGYSFVENSLGKVIVNGVVYVVTAAATVTVDTGWDLEATDEVYVEFREYKPKA